MSQAAGDQAQKLRDLMSNHQPASVAEEPGTGRVIAITSGKGGVGKSNVSINFALGLREQGQRVLIFDADVGFADVEVLLGVHPQHTVIDVLNGMSIWDAIAYDRTGLPFLSAGNGVLDIHDLSDEQMTHLLTEMSKLQDKFDVILIDSGAGMGRNIAKLLSAADDIFLVTTPEPTAIADAYALVKMMSVLGPVPPVRMVVNRVDNFVKGREAADKLRLVISKFLDIDVGILGYVLEDPTLPKAVMEQLAMLASYPDSSSSRCFRQLVRNYLRIEVKPPERGIRNFFEKLFRGNSR